MWVPQGRVQGSARPDLDHRVRDWKCLSLNNETETEKAKSQWRDPDWKCLSLNDDTETNTEKSESHWQDRDQDWKNLSLRHETGHKMSITRLLLISDSPLVEMGIIFAPWNKFDMIRVFWLVGLDIFFFLLSLINELILIEFILVW